MATSMRIGVFWLFMFLMIREFSCKPTAADTMTDVGAMTLSSTDKPAAMTGQRTSRLQKPSSQVLNTGFDEIIVESNLQVHRGGSKSKSKITLPNAANSSTAASSSQNGANGNKSARSLEV